MLLPLLALVTPHVQQEPAAASPLVSLRSSGLAAWLAHPKDVGLARVLSLASERLPEVPAELGEADVPRELVALLVELATGPLGLELGLVDEPRDAAAVPFWLEVAAKRDARDAALALARRVHGLWESRGIEVGEPAIGSLVPLEAPLPVGVGVFGDSVHLRIGERAPAAQDLGPSLLPPGATPFASGALDFGAYFDLVRLVTAQGQLPDSDVRVLTALEGAFGLAETRAEFAWGAEADRQSLVVALRGYADAARDMGLGAPLGLDFLRAIPVDATWASASAMEPLHFLRTYQALLDTLEPGAIDLMGALSSALGMDAERELFAPLGSRVAIYASDTTGGGGASSLVALAEVRDAAALRRALATLAQQHNEALGAYTEGRVAFVARVWGDLEFHTLAFVGLPIPFEVSVAVTARHVVFGLVPQAVVAAVAQIERGGTSLLDHAGFRAQAPEGLDAANAVQWIDTPRLARDGYGLISFACSALVNGLRSPAEPTRDAGLVVPAYADLVRGARGIVTTSRVVGEDYVTVYHLDGSHLVNAVGLVGQLQSGPMPLLVLAGVASSAVVPRIMAARLSSVEQKVEADLAMLDDALSDYRINNAGRWPLSLDELVRPNERGRTYLPSLTLPVDPWGKPYGYELPTIGGKGGRVYCRTYEGR